MPGGAAALRQRAASAPATFSSAPILFAARGRLGAEGMCWREATFRDSFFRRRCGATPVRGFGGPDIQLGSHFVCGSGEVRCREYFLAEGHFE